MKKYISILSLIIVSVIVFNACEKSDIEKANEDYDYNSIIPVLNGISGPSETFAAGLPITYKSIAIRGGSTYTWEYTGGIAGTIAAVEGEPWTIEITFASSTVGEEDVMLTVYETTAGGLVSERDTLMIDLLPFCPFSIDDFEGTWSGTDVDDNVGSAAVTTTIEVLDETSFVVLNTVSEQPIFCYATWVDWGEVFQAGFGNEGDVYFTMDEAGTLASAETYWGQTLPGPWDYNSTASGIYDACTGKMTIDFIMDNGWITSHTEIFKD
ncbi:MAG: hypothetical protein KAR57_08045 [Bacteroidales bacterium]|nr:hypothetical protein [Bacteroidales bacterium]